jgi:hypothetical protein
LTEALIKKEEFTDEERTELFVKLFDSDYGGLMTRSNVDTLFYVAEIGQIQASNYDTSEINYEAAGFLMGNSIFRPYRILLSELDC